jgi:sugar transferase (PEP-CTERM/EpsH1 system associated)
MTEQPLIVHIVFRLDYGGLENGVVNLVNRLSAAGRFRHAVVVLTEATVFATRLRKDVPVYSLGKREGKDLGAYYRLFRLLRELRPAAVHTRNFGTLDCAFVSFLARVPVRIHGEHGWDVADPDGTSVKHRWLRRVFAPFVHRFVTVSEHLRHWLVRAVGVSASKVVRIWNGVDTERFRPLAAPERAWCDAILQREDADGAIVVGSVTRFSAIKDPLNVVDAFVRLRSDLSQHEPPLRLVMIGDGELRDAAQARLREAGVDRAAWLPGNRDDIPALLQCMDVFVLASLREGVSNTILEAMACGLPIVATATGGTPELIDGDTGLLVPPGDSVALATAIRRYVVDGALRAEHGRAAAARAAAHFSIAAMVESYGGLYESLLNARDARRAALGARSG